MPRQRVPVQINQFIGGLNTESSPLGFPANATTDENNCSLLKDGSRRRRLGFDVETNYNTVDTSLTFDDTKTIARNQFRWENPGGFPERQFMVVQIGNYVGVHDLDDTVLSNTPVYTFTFDSSVYDVNFNFAVVDGVLAIATGLPQITLISYNGTTFTKTDEDLLVRDFFGVEAVVDSVELTSAQNQTTRPANINDEHLYNLRNQTFALPRVNGDSDVTTLVDPIERFRSASGDTVYPSNNDSAVPHTGPNPNFASNRTVDRFRGVDLFRTPTGTGESPKGYFIINALSRGTSRIAQEAQLRAENSSLSLSVTSLPTDTTPGGATVLAQFSGRIWYAGFSGTVTDGDRLSPRMSSYILFSQVVEDPTQITRCYQEADPTSNIDPDIVATDGGFVKLDGAYNILAMVELQNSLFVFAENGVWQIAGSAEQGFTAENYSVRKLGSEGCVSSNAVIRFEQTVMYWGESAIYAILQNETGGWSLQNITRDSIQTFYDGIDAQSRAYSVGYYDFESDSFRWLYGNTLENPAEIHELVFNTKFRVFTKNSVLTSDNTFGPITVSGGQRFSGNAEASVTVGGEAVTVGGELVTVPKFSSIREARASFYTIILDRDPTITYTFGGFTNENPLDWVLLGDDVDSPAYLTTGSITGGDARLRKEVPYLTTYFRRTEDPALGDTESSCFASSRWDWTSGVNTSRWSTPREMYRPVKTDTGNDVVVTRNRIRGAGHSVSFHFESTEGKTFRLYGWEHNLDAGTEE